MTDKSNLILDLTKAYNDSRCTDYKESIKCVLDMLESSENKGEWIPVTERLPENDTEVVYCTEMGTVGSCHYFEGFNNYRGCDRDYLFDDVVAWLPIPEPYKAESEVSE